MLDGGRLGKESARRGRSGSDRFKLFIVLSTVIVVVVTVGVVKAAPSLLGPGGTQPAGAAALDRAAGDSTPLGLGAEITTTTHPAAPATPVAVDPATPAPAGYVAPPPAPVSISLPTPPAYTLLVEPKGVIQTFISPDGPILGTTGVWYSYQLVLPVLQSRPGWYYVRLPLRPNESTGWVRASDVTTSETPYWIEISLSGRRLVVFDAGQEILSFPVGIGVPNTPTPTGNFFVAVHETNPPPGYGPFVLDTSAHSEAIQSWDGAGDAVIAIHGPISSYADYEIGSTGARVSNGCVRMHDSDLAQLAMIPLGTPVDIYP